MKPFLLIIFILIFSTCTTTKLTYIWKENKVPAKIHSKILVLAIIDDTDNRIKDRMEAHISDDLQKLGYDAIPAMQNYGPKHFERFSEIEAVSQIRNWGFDAVLTAVLLDKETEKLYYTNRNCEPKPFWPYITRRLNNICECCDETTVTNYFWESNFYEMENLNLLYAAQSTSFAVQDIENMSHQYGILLVKNMVKNGLLKKHKNGIKGNLVVK